MNLKNYSKNMGFVGTLYSDLENDDSEIGKIVKESQKIAFNDTKKSGELLLEAAEKFGKIKDFFNAGYFYRRGSETLLFSPTERNMDDIVSYGNKSIDCFQKILNDENETHLRKACSALEILSQHRLSLFMEKTLGDSPIQNHTEELKKIASDNLSSYFKTLKNEKAEFELLFNGVQYEFSNTKVTRGPGLIQLLIDTKNFQEAYNLAKDYEEQMYYDDKAWLYVAKAFLDDQNRLINLEKAAELFSKDTHENFEKYGKDYGRSFWSFGNESLWANFFKGQALLLQKSNSGAETKDLLKEASSRFSAITEHHLFPSATFLAVLCEGLANFIETRDITIFKNLENDLTNLIQRYTKGYEEKADELISCLNNGLDFFKNNIKIAIKDNNDLKKAIELISTLDHWSHLNIFNVRKKSIVEQASFLLPGKLENFEKIIKEFEILLSSVVKEEKLQEFLTLHPLLFGMEYKEIKPKHSLGVEFIMDYALRTYNDAYHLIEIEKSTDVLYTKAGDPSSQLVHAEQQIQNWLIWLEENNSYARKFLPDIISPKGFIIIGRNKTFNSQLKIKLQKRNMLYGEKIEILTYDDLLEKAKTTLQNLKNI